MTTKPGQEVAVPQTPSGRQEPIGSERVVPASSRRVLPLVALAVAVLAALPLLDIGNFYLLSLSGLFMWIALASSWNLSSGFTGYLDLGHVTFFGVGAYTTAILISDHGVNVAVTLAPAAALAGLTALLIGPPLLKLKGMAFPIATLGLYMAMRELAAVATPITNGNGGIPLPPVLNRPLFYYAYLACAVTVVGLAYFVRRRPIGGALLAIREDEIGAEARGIAAPRLKLGAYAASSAITGAVGGVWAYETGFIDPQIVFRDIIIITIVLIAVLGGAGTVTGPVIGAIVFIALRDTLWANFVDIHRALFGGLLIAVVMFVPEGIVGVWTRPERTRLGRWVARLRGRMRQS